MRVDPVTVETLPEIVDLGAMYHAETRFAGHPHHLFDEGVLLEKLSFGLLSGSILISLATVDSESAGFALGTVGEILYNRNKAMVDAVFYVAPRHRGSAVARALLDNLQTRARAAGCVRIEVALTGGVMVRETVALLRRAGYTDEDRFLTKSLE